MNIEVVAKEGLKRELTIEVPADIVDQTYSKIYDELRKKVKIDGFRPGKIPEKVIRNRFKQEATAELVDELVGKYLRDALIEKKLEPAGDPVLSKVDVAEGKPLTFTIGVEVMPTIETIKYDNLTIQEAKTDIPDSDVDHIIEHIRKANSELRGVERPAAIGDVLICDLEATGGETAVLEGKTLANQEIDLGNEMTVKEFRDELAGVKRDETRDVTINYAADYSDQLFAGKTVTYKIHVKEVKERILPPVDDNFAKMAGQGETVLELRLNIRKRLEEDKKQDQKRTDQTKLIEQLVAQNQVEVPESMVESYLKNVIDDFKQGKEPFDEKEIREKYRPAGMGSIRWYLLFHRLAELEKIEVSKEDSENWLKRFAERYKMDIPKAREVVAKTGKASEIRDGILENKVLDFLAGKAQILKG